MPQYKVLSKFLWYMFFSLFFVILSTLPSDVLKICLLTLALFWIVKAFTEYRSENGRDK